MGTINPLNKDGKNITSLFLLTEHPQSQDTSGVDPEAWCPWEDLTSSRFAKENYLQPCQASSKLLDCTLKGMRMFRLICILKGTLSWSFTLVIDVETVKLLFLFLAWKSMRTKSVASPIVLYPKSVPEQYWQLLSNRAAFTLRTAAACRNRQPPGVSSPLGRQVDTLHVQWRGAKVHWIVNPILCCFDFPGGTQFLSSKNQAYAQAWNLWCRIIIDHNKL